MSIEQGAGADFDFGANDDQFNDANNNNFDGFVNFDMGGTADGLAH